MIENTLPDKSGSPKNLEKQSQRFESFSTNVLKSWRGFSEGVLQVVLSTIL